MMKKLISTMLLICLLCAAAAASADGHKTPLQEYTSWGRPCVEIANPVYPQNKSAAELNGNDGEICQMLARAWYNLLAYETSELGTDIQKTMAASIYRSIKKGPGVSIFIASDADAVCINAMFAYNEEAYWLEWDLDTQIIRYLQQYGVGPCKTDNDFLSDYVFNSLLYAAAEGIAITGKLPDGVVSKAYGTKTQIYKLFDQAYSTATGKNNPIK